MAGSPAGIQLAALSTYSTGQRQRHLRISPLPCRLLERGLKIGALVGLLVWLGADLVLYGLFEFTTLIGVLADSASAIVQYGVAGAAIGAVAGMGAKATAA